MSNLTIKNQKFYMDDKEFQIFSGAIHYFRTMPTEWEDRLLKLKKCGFNTVETYVAWNMHEPIEGKFNYEGICDIVKFIEIAHKLDLYVILRPGPYICAEWEFGGFPSWLLKYSDLKLRCMNKTYLQKVDKFFDSLIPKITPFLSTNGGNIIAMQVENEYGSYGCDKDYLNYIKDGLIKRGVDVLLFTSDGSPESMLKSGSIEGVLPTVNFGSKPDENFASFNKLFSEQPKMCMEYWCGWFEHWGEEKIVRDGDSVVSDLENMISTGKSFNLYMFHGGTNFGFMNGANCIDGEGYRATTTSYDYNAPLNESGEPTEKYWKLKDLLNPNERVEFHKEYGDYGEVCFSQFAPLFENINLISKKVKSSVPMTFEELDYPYGYVLYKTTVDLTEEKRQLRLMELHDRAEIFINGEKKATYCRGNNQEKLIEISGEGKAELSFLVENLGRINYGPYLTDKKGLLNGVWLGEKWGNYLHGFEHYPIDFNKLNKLQYRDYIETKNAPVFLKGEFHVDEPLDTFVDLTKFNKGLVFINGFHLGRYWNIGPQYSLYVPKDILLKGKNEIVIFEQDFIQSNTVRFNKNR